VDPGLLVARDSSGQLAVRLHDSAALKAWAFLKFCERYSITAYWGKVDKQEMKELDRDRRLVIKRWGERLREDYEWARPATSKAPKEQINLRDLEIAVGLRERRAIYRFFSHGVHITSTRVVDHFYTGFQYGASFPAGAPFLILTCLTALSDITLVTSTALAIPLQADGQVRIARGIEFLRVFFEPDDASVEEPDSQ